MSTEKEKHAWGGCIIALFSLFTVFPCWCFLVYSLLETIEPTTMQIIAFWLYVGLSIPIRLVGILWGMLKPE
jgi:hypothetical protein